MKTIIALLSFPLFLLSAPKDPPPPPEVIEKELDEAQTRFEEAKRMFNPWYAGPLLTGSANTVDPGKYNQQPYLFVNDFYGIYDKNEKLRSQPDEVQTNSVYIAQTGLAKGWDLKLTLQGFYNRREGKGGGGFGDLSLETGIALVQQTPWIPAIKLGLTETFPTGKYDDLNPENNGIDATGAGAFSTTVSLNFSKVVWWVLLHPMNFRLSLNYTIPSHVSVTNFHAYGGADGASGTIKPGQSFTGNFAAEYSFTKYWVLAMDLSYVNQGRTRFTGNPGRLSTGEFAPSGTPSNEQLSLAPALEYNPYANMGFVGGVWFTVYGRNSSAFISGVITYYQMF